MGVGVAFVGDFCLGKIALSSLWNKIKMPKLKMLHLVKMDVCILFATNVQIDAAHFCNVFPKLRFIPA